VIGDQVTPAEAKEYIRRSGYDRLILEERLVGEEFTVQAFVADGHLRVTPAVQDHKRAYEGDDGPNTGGMGSYSDAGLALPFIDEDDYMAAVDILRATVDALDGYKGVLYGQFMLTAEGVKVVEFNARFGDPEAMNTLPVLNTDLLDVLTAARDGEPLPKLNFERRATVCKYAVPAGYPTDPRGGTQLRIDEASVTRSATERSGRTGTEHHSGETPETRGTPPDDRDPRNTGDAILFYASVDERDDGIYTTTSRSFAVVGIADSIAEAESVAADAIGAAGEEGIRVRHDIGTPALIQRRIDHAADLQGE
jgi:phosphoribosylamine--glycine ligase